MDIDVENRRHLAAITVVAAVASVAVAAGFAVVSTNPLVPDAQFDVADADDEYDLNQTGTVDMFVITHEEGERIDVTDLELIIGPRSDGARFNATANWTIEPGEIRFRTTLNGDRIADGDEFAPGDRLRVSKVEGTGPTPETIEFRIRLFHIPSQRAILDRSITVD